MGKIAGEMTSRLLMQKLEESRLPWTKLQQNSISFKSLYAFLNIANLSILS
jgi:hypothetical protein